MTLKTYILKLVFSRKIGKGTIPENQFLIHYKFVKKNQKNIPNTQKDTEFHRESIVVFIYHFSIYYFKVLLS